MLPEKYGITDKQFRFAQEYIIDLDPQAAAVRAGYDANYAQSLMSHPLVHQAIRDLNQVHKESLQMSADEAREVLSNIARTGFDEFHEQDPDTGKLRLKKDIPPEKLQNVRSIKVDRQGNQYAILYDKQAAAATVLKAHGAFVQKHEISGNVNVSHTHLDVTTLIQEMTELLEARRSDAIEADYEVKDDGPLSEDTN